MPDEMTRRKFFERSAIAATVAGGLAGKVGGAAVGVPLKFPSGEIRTLRFTPLCSNTSNLTLCETPLVFRSAET